MADNIKEGVRTQYLTSVNAFVNNPYCSKQEHCGYPKHPNGSNIL